MEKEKGKVIVGKIPYKFTSSYYRKVKFYLKSNKCEAFKTTKQTSIPFLSSNQSTSSGLDKNLLGNSSSELMITQTDDQTVNASFSTSFALHPGQNSNNDKILHEMFNNDEIINEYCVEDESNDEEYNIQEKKLSMMEELKNWSLQNRITHTAVSQLLVLLSKHGIKHLPKDCRTLLRTPRTIFIRQMGPSGEFWYGGIKQCLLDALSDVQESIQISLNFNIDGLPISRSSKFQFWPILVNIANMPNISPMVIAIYCGDCKPPSVEEFLREFVNELNEILKNGIRHFRSM